VDALTRISIRRPVATAMLFAILLVVGVVSLRSLPVDLLPQVEFTQLTVRISYPNVGPREIEKILTDPIENAVSGLPNLERVTSESEEGRSQVRLEFARGTNVDEAANDLRAALDRLRDELPVEAEPPEILKLDLDRIEVVSMAATSTRPLAELTLLLENDLARRFEQVPGVGAIQLRGGIYREIRVELDRDRLKAAGLTALDVERALEAENAALPGGNVKSGTADLYVRPRAEYTSVDQIRRTVVAAADGFPVRVRDVAQVVDGYEDVQYLAEVNGVPSVSIGIQKQSGANTVAVAEAIRGEVERINAERDDLHLTIYSDQSEFIRQSIASVRSSALWGSLLAVVVLYLFLRSGTSTAIIALAIPISVISTFGLLYFAGLTLNQMTFGGLALGVGLIVDNAIVVLESIVRKQEEEGVAPRQAAQIGTREVTGAIVASTLTTCVIFLPVVFTRTTSGALFQALALVVVFALACSLLVALTVVPTLAAKFLRRERLGGGGEAKGGGLFRRLEGWYVERLRAAMRHRGRVFAATGAALAAAALLWPLIPVELAPQSDADEIDVEIEMAQGTNMAVVRAYVDELEARVREVLPPDVVEIVSTEVRGGNAEVELKLVPQHRRSMSSTAVADLLREAVEGKVPGAEIRVDAQPGLWILRRIFSSGGGEEELEIELRGWDLERADEVAADLRRRIEAIPGITGVRVSRREGRPEENLELDRERIAELGLSVEDVGRVVQANVGGVEAGRFREGGEEYPITVRLKPGDRLNAQDLRNVALRPARMDGAALDGAGGAASGVGLGDMVPLSAVVRRERGRGPTAIEHVDGQRVTYVTADLEGDLPLGEAVARIQRELEGEALPEGFSLLFGGEYVEQQEAQRDFTVAIVTALLLVYMLMAAQFERFVDPLIVMVSVPMTLVGVVPTLLLTGTTLNIQSVMGLVMLIGIVVNNAIVLVDAFNLLRRERHMGIAEAVIEGGRLRLRPILLTSSTTVLGLAPLALGIGVGAEIQASLARVVIGGLVASTLVTLLLIPVLYSSAGRLASRVRRGHLWRRRRRSERGEPRDDRATA
jgi:HAE1 family hydrophobic/amphiphilic exporter-1